MTDEQLMARVVGGDMEALGVLFERRRQSLFAFLCRFLLDEGMAEDVLVESFLRVFDRRHSFKPDFRFTTWLFTIAHHLAIDHLKRRLRQEKLQRKLVEDAPLVQSRDDEFADIEQAKMVREAIAALPDEQRVVIILRTYHDLSYREIARIIGATEEAVRVRSHRARQALRKRLGPLLREDNEPCNIYPGGGV